MLACLFAFSFASLAVLLIINILILHSVIMMLHLSSNSIVEIRIYLSLVGVAAAARREY